MSTWVCDLSQMFALTTEGASLFTPTLSPPSSKSVVSCLLTEDAIIYLKYFRKIGFIEQKCSSYQLSLNRNQAVWVVWKMGIEIYTIFFFWWLHSTASGILVPQPGIEPRPWQWKCQILTTGPLGNSPMYIFSMLTYGISVGLSMEQIWDYFHYI